MRSYEFRTASRPAGGHCMATVLGEMLAMMMGRISDSAKSAQLGPSCARASSLMGPKYPGSTPRTPAVGMWLTRDGPVHLLLPPLQQRKVGGRRTWSGPSRANHAPTTGVLGLDPGYFEPCRVVARTRDGPSCPRSALPLMESIVGQQRCMKTVFPKSRRNSHISVQYTSTSRALLV